MNPLYKSMQSIKTSTARINKTTDDAVAAVNIVEKFLTECAIGVHAEIDVEGERDLKLAYWRYNNQNFRIVVMEDREAQNGSIKPWAECDRSTKLLTVKYLPDLLKAINEVIEADAKLADAAQGPVTSVTEFVRSLGVKS